LVPLLRTLQVVAGTFASAISFIFSRKSRVAPFHRVVKDDLVGDLVERRHLVLDRHTAPHLAAVLTRG